MIVIEAHARAPKTRYVLMKERVEVDNDSDLAKVNAMSDLATTWLNRIAGPDRTLEMMDGLFRNLVHKNRRRGAVFTTREPSGQKYKLRIRIKRS